jgi:hypothetical protein
MKLNILQKHYFYEEKEEENIFPIKIINTNINIIS